jgi:hypothetical protein
MAYFKIAEPGKAVKYIKEIDRANGTLEFSETKDGCFQQDSGFFADSEFAYLKFHFTEAYPELEYMSIDTSWRTEEDLGGRVAAAIQEAPIDPNPWEEMDAVEEAPHPIEQHNVLNAYNMAANPVMEAAQGAYTIEVNELPW